MLPQMQTIGVNDRLGNTAVRDMQGTTRDIYHIISVPAAYNRFFENVQLAPFPLSNINENKFQPGETLAVMGAALFTIPTTQGVVNLADPIDNYIQGNLTTRNTLLNFLIGGQVVAKDLSLQYGGFGVGKVEPTAQGGSGINQTFYFETPIVIPPQIEFVAEVQLETVPANTAIGLILFGFGTLLNTQNNY